MKAHTFFLPSGKWIKRHGCELYLCCTSTLFPHPSIQTLQLGAFKHFTNLTCKDKTLCHFTDGKTEISNLPNATEQSSSWAQNRTTSAFVRDDQHTSVLCQHCFYHHLCTSIALLHCSQQPLHGRPTLIISEESGYLDAN